MVKEKYTVAIILSVSLHLALAAILLFGDFTTEHKPTPQLQATVQPIQAVAVNKSELESRVNQLKKQKADAKAAELKRLKELEDRAKKAKQERAREQERIKRLEADRKRKEREKRQADLAAKKAKADADRAEKARKQKEDERKKAEQAAAVAEKKRKAEELAAQKAEELRKKQEAERKRKEAEAAAKAKAEKERQLQEQMLAEQMAAEMQAINQLKSQQVQGEIEKQKAIFSSLIQQNTLEDESFKGKKCTVTVNLTSQGSVKYISVKGGDKFVCDAIKNGAYRVGTFPMTNNPDVDNQLMQFDLTFIK